MDTQIKVEGPTAGIFSKIFQVKQRATSEKLATQQIGVNKLTQAYLMNKQTGIYNFFQKY